MPIEIRELVIKATVHKAVKRQGSQGISKKELRAIKREILEQCKEEILRQFEKRDQR